MRLAHIHQLVHFTPWLILPLAHASIRAVLESKMGESADAPRADFFADMAVKRNEATMAADGIGVAHLLGPVGTGLSKMEKTCGMTDLADFRGEISGMIDQGAKGILIDMDSPGGTVYGTSETAALIADAPVPVVVHVDSGLMASAAYWVGSGATRIYATESSEIGSIGVYIPWADQSARYKAAGVEMELITNKEGIYKGAGYPGTKLSDDQRAAWQASVDRIYGEFSGAVKAHRGDVPDDAMQGQTFGAAQAVEKKLIDGVATRDAAMGALRALIKKANG
jgi:signal peptide peptidase SppA